MYTPKQMKQMVDPKQDMVYNTYKGIEIIDLI